jgi:phospholipase C
VLGAQQPRAVGERPLKQRDCLVRPPSSVVGHHQACEAIRNSPVWDTSLLIITYDEHGGFYDSVAPPAALPLNDGSPSTYNQWGFTFAQLGVRVPAVVVSPWIAPHTVDHTVYDHSSVPATIERLFGLPPLTARDEAANDVTPLFTEPHPRTNAPARLNYPAPPVLRPAIDPQTAQASLSEPIPESGSLPGFLQIMLKTDLELSTTPQERDEAQARHTAVTTRGDARSYINYVMAKAQAAKT